MLAPVSTNLPAPDMIKPLLEVTGPAKVSVVPAAGRKSASDCKAIVRAIEKLAVVVRPPPFKYRALAVDPKALSAAILGYEIEVPGALAPLLRTRQPA